MLTVIDLPPGPLKSVTSPGTLLTGTAGTSATSLPPPIFEPFAQPLKLLRALIVSGVQEGNFLPLTVAFLGKLRTTLLSVLFCSFSLAIVNPTVSASGVPGLPLFGEILPLIVDCVAIAAGAVASSSVEAAATAKVRPARVRTIRSQ